jgi:hypothetical protein
VLRIQRRYEVPFDFSVEQVKLAVIGIGLPAFEVFELWLEHRA